MNKAIILTRTSTINFGTVLQSYALQQVIKSLGYDVYVLDDKKARTLYSNSSTNFIERHQTLKEVIYNYLDTIKLHIEYAREECIERKVNSFKKRYIKYFYMNDLQQLIQMFDIFVSGSDQIWAKAAEPELFPFFMQDFVPADKKKISYAVSIGQSGYPTELSNIISELANDFDSLSVREESSQKTLGAYVKNKPISIVCDPVLHIPSKQWSRLGGRRKIKGRYIFCYLLSYHDWYVQKIKEIKQKSCCAVYIYCSQRILNSEGVVLKTCSPKEFLNYIQYADFVLTDSYHAMLFSLIFEKNFCVLKRFIENGSDLNTQNGRIIYVLDRIMIQNKMIGIDEAVNTDQIDYKQVNPIIKQFKYESISYLKNALE